MFILSIGTQITKTGCPAKVWCSNWSHTNKKRKKWTLSARYEIPFDNEYCNAYFRNSGFSSVVFRCSNSAYIAVAIFRVRGRSSICLQVLLWCEPYLFAHGVFHPHSASPPSRPLRDFPLPASSTLNNFSYDVNKPQELKLHVSCMMGEATDTNSTKCFI
jgi:hypothetical protein